MVLKFTDHAMNQSTQTDDVTQGGATAPAPAVSDKCAAKFPMMAQITLAPEAGAASPRSDSLAVGTQLSAKQTQEKEESAPKAVTPLLQVKEVTSTSADGGEAAAAPRAKSPKVAVVVRHTNDLGKQETTSEKAGVTKGAYPKRYPNSQISLNSCSLLRVIGQENAAAPRTTPATNSAMIMDKTHQVHVTPASWRDHDQQAPGSSAAAGDSGKSKPSLGDDWPANPLWRTPADGQSSAPQVRRGYPLPETHMLLSHALPLSTRELLDRCADINLSLRCFLCSEGSHTLDTCALRHLPRTPLQRAYIKRAKIMAAAALSLREIAQQELMGRGYTATQILDYVRRSDAAALMEKRQGAPPTKILARLHLQSLAQIRDEVTPPRDFMVIPPAVPAKMRRGNDTPASIAAYNEAIRDTAKTRHFALHPFHPAATASNSVAATPSLLDQAQGRVDPDGQERDSPASPDPSTRSISSDTDDPRTDATRSSSVSSSVSLSSSEGLPQTPKQLLVRPRFCSLIIPLIWCKI
jgi:hypothetical protein